jgi:hypothetical protein
MKLYLVGIAIVLTGLVASCKKTKNNNTNPVITLQGLDSNTVVSGASNDTVFIRFQVVDGDGDIAHDKVGSGDHDIYITDSRTGEVLPYWYPDIPSGSINPEEGVNAFVTLRVLAAFISTRLDHPLGDTLTYDLYVKDKAGHQSNVITTPKVYILPKP